MHPSSTAAWRDIVGKHHTAMVDELTAHLDSHIKDLICRATAAERARSAPAAGASDPASRASAEDLNLSLRRLRNAPTEEKLFQVLAETSAPYVGRAVVLVFESNQARSVASAGFNPTQSAVRVNQQGSVDISFETNTAQAVVSAIESRDPVVALLTPKEISLQLAAAFTLSPSKADYDIDDRVDPESAKAWLFPIVSRHSVVAMLIVSAGPTKTIASAPVQMLCEATGLKLEALSSPAAAPGPVASAAAAGGRSVSQLVKLGAPAPSAETSKRRAWDELSRDDQRLHLQAQRNARVRVAEMRLYREPAIRKGIASESLYTALKPEIDGARAQFLQNFLSKSPTMVDYIHLELLRTLAHDDDRLLGPDYPGPMV